MGKPTIAHQLSKMTVILKKYKCSEIKVNYWADTKTWNVSFDFNKERLTFNTQDVQGEYFLASVEFNFNSQIKEILWPWKYSKTIKIWNEEN